MAQQPEKPSFLSIDAQRQAILAAAKRYGLPEPTLIFYEDGERNAQEERIDIDTTEMEGNNT